MFRGDMALYKGKFNRSCLIGGVNVWEAAGDLETIALTVDICVYYDFTCLSLCQGCS